MNFKTDITFIKQIKLQDSKFDLEQIEADKLGILRNNITTMELNGIKDRYIYFSYLDSSNEEIEYYFNKSQLALIKILEKKGLENQGIISIQIILFPLPLEYIYENFYININDKLQDKKLHERDFLININDNKYLIISSGKSTEDKIFLSEDQKISVKIKKLEQKLQKARELKEQETIQKLEQEKQELNAEFDKLDSNKIAFSLTGDKRILAIERINKANDLISYKATKLIPLQNKTMQNLRLVAIKNFAFKDDSIKANIKEALESGELTSQYLDIWDEHDEIYGDILLKQAREIGEVEVEYIEEESFCLKVNKDLREKLDSNDYICFMNETPSYLTNKSLSFKEYLQESMDAKKLQLNDDKEQIKTYKIESVTSNTITLEKGENLNLDSIKGKKFSLSIFGDFVALKRKYISRKRVLEGKSANPLLPMIFAKTLSENLKIMLKSKKPNTYLPLSDRILNKVFPKNKPTQNQEEAIKVAINTPDIAIIQGPPGTGKTTILNAIIERLNELSDKGISKKGSIFIGGFQHSAVENLINRMSLNGLPIIKYGRKSNQSEGLKSYENLMKFSNEIAECIYIKEDSENIQKFKKLAASYVLRASTSKACELLKAIIDTKEPVLHAQRQIAKERLDTLLKQDIIKDKTQDLALIYAIRETNISFSDDGIARNKDLLRSVLATHISENDKKILSNTTFSKELVNLKYKLLKTFTPQIKFEKEKQKQDLINLAQDVIDNLNNLSIESKINLALAEFKNKLESNPFILNDIIQEYSVAFSATTGQSSKYDILQAKGVSESNTEQYESYSYDNVIIDEAAMVSPSDLFLVLVLAKQRIILVGDHRQLPHKVNEEVLEKLNRDSKADSIESDLLKKSIFSYLKEKAQELEKIDGIKRFITLNNQYRTHPKLAKLVSDIYYKPYKEEYESPLSESNFKHNLKDIENHFAIWIDIPYIPSSKERDTRDGTSRIRECEAKTIINKLVEWISSENGKDLSYGIISFYAAQVAKLAAKLKEKLDSIQDDNIKEKLQKVKVGSVDSFQGMEFDIVFLSLVRSGEVKEDSTPKQIFGFLCSPNRLCVALSRQKKALIAVGDKSYFTNSKAQEHVKGLYEFAKLCESEGKVL